MTGKDTVAELVSPTAFAEWPVRLDDAGMPHREIPVSELLACGWAPVEVVGDDVIIATGADDLDQVRRSALKWLPGRHLRLHRVDRVALQDALVRNREDEVADHMANNFPDNFPELTAKTGYARWQVVAGFVVMAGFTVMLVIAPALLAGVLSGGFVLFSALHITIGLASLGYFRRTTDQPSEPISTDADAPFFTVLIPAYREVEVIGDLVCSLSELDYPKDRVEVLFLVEQHDPETRAAILDAGLEPHMRVVDLARGAPQTKPRGCNLGLLLARGDLVVIFDAEDHPEPDQLRKAAAAFTADVDGTLACVQAKLLFHNSAQNLLTHQFAMEYNVRYELLKPGLARLGLPIPLGGTSNYFRTDILRRIGGWDAWNVTEDADLGMRIKALGYRVGMIDSVTWEEATATVRSWIRQRSRWHKGFMMTFLVHTRRPLDTVRRFGLSGLVTLVGIVAGSSLINLTMPLTALIIVLDLIGVLRGGATGDAFSSPAIVMLPAMILAVTVWVGATIFAACRRRTPRPYLGVLLPAYWLLTWFATWRALIQLVRSPFRWEKTVHHTTLRSTRSEGGQRR